MRELADAGQSVWLDYIDRPLLETGKLAAMIESGLRGMTSNPTIFNNAIGSTTDYDAKIRGLKESGKSTLEIYDALTIRDIQEAADHFKGVYKATGGLDGYVSLEIDPQIAHHADKQVQEGLRLFKKVGRANVMIKVPATTAGVEVIEELIARGVNVNATLIFSIGQYERVARAYYRGLNRRSAEVSDLSAVHSVASVFISRIDTSVDKMIDARSAKETDNEKKRRLQSLRGKAAAANSRVIFETWKKLEEETSVKALKGKSANVQRILWASTGTKDPAYSDIKYVTELICAPTVNTLPEKTLDAFLDHGEVRGAFTGSAQDALDVLGALRSFGIDVDEVCRDLLVKGVAAFEGSFKELTVSIEKKAAALSSAR
jgi:transaldolase